MNLKSTTDRCPICGTVLPENAPHGLCPKCLLAGVSMPTEPGGNPMTRPALPSIEAIRNAFPQLEVIELIGQGGMGAVFKARQPRLNRFVALKVLPEALGQDPAFAERFTREAQILARLNHPNLVTIHDFGQSNGLFYLLMEFVDGVNLRQAMSAGRFTPAQALAIVPKICEALQYAHDEGVLHRDIKPENILLDVKGRVRLVDFGIAKLTAATLVVTSAGTCQSESPNLTQSGATLGTPRYMAPEQQTSPETVDPRADIYSLGVVFYEMLTGELPSSHLERPSQKSPIDPRIDEVVLRAMARQKEQRFDTAAAVCATVKEIMTTPQPNPASAAAGQPIQVSSSSATGLAVGFFILTGLILFQLKPATVLTNFAVWYETNKFERILHGIGICLVFGFMVFVWSKRVLFLTPFLQENLWIDRASGANKKDWGGLPLLRQSCLILSAALSLEILVILMWETQGAARVLTSQQRGLNLWGLLALAVTITPLAFTALLICFLIRRELSRNETVAVLTMPPWLNRAAPLFLVFALISVIPWPHGDLRIIVLNLGGFSALGAIAILTRSRIWRALAIGFTIQMIVLGFVGLFSFGFAHSMPPELMELWSARIGPFTGMQLSLIVQSLSLVCNVTGLVALLNPSAAAAFGVPPRNSVEATLSPSPA